MKKTHAVFDALWFNVVAGVISVIVLAKQVWELTTEGDAAKPIALLIIWIVICFHFMRKTYYCLRDTRTDPGRNVI